MTAPLLKVVIADDEQLARRGLRQLLESDSNVSIVAECETGEQTVTVLRRLDLAIDVLFLDVQMPLGDGFAVLEALPPSARPVIVFVTAFARYAQHAFDAQALDYVLKPLERSRVQEAVTRAREQVRLRRLARYDERLEELLTRHAPNTAESARSDGGRPGARIGPRQRVAVPGRDGVRLLDESDIDLIEAFGYYARLRVGRETILLRESLDALESRLDSSRFVRVHRSAIVNVDRIRTVRAHTYGRALAMLVDGTKLIVSRSRRAAVRAAIGWPAGRRAPHPQRDGDG